MSIPIVARSPSSGLAGLLESRALLYFFVLFTVLVVWVPRYPPLIDLPQHAAQVSLLLDLLRGESAWGDNVQLNFFTPYLVGYGLLALMAQFLPIAAAVKMVLSLAIVGFFWAASSLRKHLNAPPVLDWLVLCSFFGFAFKWGFMTFLVAAPVGLLFIKRTIIFAEKPGFGSGLIVALLGVVTFFSHGLVFIGTLAIGTLYSLWNVRSLRDFALRMAPYAVLALLAATYFYFARQAANNDLKQDSSILWEISLKRPFSFFAYQWTIMSEDKMLFSQVVMGFIHLFMLALPFLLGMRLRPSLRRFTPLLVLAVVATVAPSMAMTTYFLYQRFALFIMAFYVLLFEVPSTPPRLGALGRAALLALPLLCFTKSAMVMSQFHEFDKESADFSRAMERMPAGQRVMAVVDARGSDAMHGTDTYLHVVAWYQAEHKGFLEMNFAQFLPQIVRYKPGVKFVKAPAEWDPRLYEWDKHRMASFDAFVVRSADPDSWLPAKAPCPLNKVIHEGLWSVYQPSAACRRLESTAVAAH